MKRVKLKNGSARVEDNCPEEVVDVLNDISQLYKSSSTTDLIIGCDHQIKVEDIHWSRCVKCGEIKPTALPHE